MGPFNRRGLDRRFVKQVVTLQHQPHHWLPMDLFEIECKLMEVKKYSAPYYAIDSRFRRPDLELITAYHVQNPFLYGMYMLRKEQLAMQLAEERIAVKEKLFYFPTTFKNLELILRNNFNAAIYKPIDQMLFYTNSEMANHALDKMKKDNSNPRVMLVARVAVGVNRDVEDEIWEKAFSGPRPEFLLRLPYFLHTETPQEDGEQSNLAIDTFSNRDKTIFIKTHINEVYPEHVLVYRDKNGGADNRNSRLSDVIQNCQLAYRAGTRFNPDEVTFEGSKEAHPHPGGVGPNVQGGRKKSAGKQRKSRREDEGAVITQQPQSTVPDTQKGGEDNGAKGAIPKRHATKDTKVEKEHEDEILTETQPFLDHSGSNSPNQSRPDHMRMQIRADIVREHNKKTRFAHHEE